MTSCENFYKKKFCVFARMSSITFETRKTVLTKKVHAVASGTFNFCWPSADEKWVYMHTEMHSALALCFSTSKLDALTNCKQELINGFVVEIIIIIWFVESRSTEWKYHHNYAIKCFIRVASFTDDCYWCVWCLQWKRSKNSSERWK